MTNRVAIFLQLSYLWENRSSAVSSSSYIQIPSSNFFPHTILFSYYLSNIPLLLYLFTLAPITILWIAKQDDSIVPKHAQQFLADLPFTDPHSYPLGLRPSYPSKLCSNVTFIMQLSLITANICDCSPYLNGSIVLNSDFTKGKIYSYSFPSFHQFPMKAQVFWVEQKLFFPAC